MSSPAALMALIQNLQQELQNQRIELQALRADVQRLQNHASAPRSYLPDPPRFDGKSYTLRTWVPSIRAKLRSSQLTGADAFDYVWDRLEQPQQASVLHLRQLAEASQSWDPEILFSFFQRICHNPREQQEALQRLTTIRQRDDETLIAYLARFERFIFEADASSWPDVTRVTTLHRGLRSSLRQTLEEDDDSLFNLAYDAYVERVQRADRRTRRPQPQAAQKEAFKAARPSEPRYTEPMQLNALELYSAPSAASSRHSSSDRADQRFEHELCYYCGSSDHWIADCPSTEPTSRKPRTRKTARCSRGGRSYSQRLDHEAS